MLLVNDTTMDLEEDDKFFILVKFKDMSCNINNGMLPLLPGLSVAYSS